MALRPRTIDRHVVRGELNLLEAQAFARIVRVAAADVAVVDACDANAARFGRRVAGLSGRDCRVVARHHADRDDPVVGAASIVAKVRRDRAIARLSRRLDRPLGSGYPSDPRTVAVVRAAVAGAQPLPEWIRGSWATVQRVKPARPARRLEEFAP